MSKLTASFTFVKSTKNTHKYDEVVQAGKPFVIGQLYVTKQAFGEAAPVTLTVTVEAPKA